MSKMSSEDYREQIKKYIDRIKSVKDLEFLLSIVSYTYQNESL